ncbi:mediator of RNA polymerase II transcription subunit 28 [Trichogramma pretiosum]|uniref:mediator of RNA polymerase II transcription subunit 28 n=1 Tax=Trichogramma pretiosum TaxID=7493 RepID=UPI0006C9B3AC|nr:mediator of RNA polymerase II transcription subunit 28 [Trichogramma pretiosum]
MATSNNGNGNVIDEFEESFQQYLNLFTKNEGFEKQKDLELQLDKDESKLEVDQVFFRFIDMARQVEAFFLQRRFLLSVLKPELPIKEEIMDLKTEIFRKEEMIKKHHDKVVVWQNLLAEMHGWAQPNGSSCNVPNMNQQTNSGNNTNNQHHYMSQPIHSQSPIQHHAHLQNQQPPNASMQMNLQANGVPTIPQNVFANQGNMGPSRNPGFGLPVNNSSSLQGPLAYLEKTTSNIGMPDRRS